MGISTLGATASGGQFTRAEILTTSGTWTHPDGASAQNPKPIYVVLTGGGGGGGYYGGGGASGVPTSHHGGGGGSGGGACFAGST